MKFVALITVGMAPLAMAAASTRRHFYTTQAGGEYARQDGFTGQPLLLGFADVTGGDGIVPLYRCRNVGSDAWLLTTDPNCEGSGFVREGVVFNVFTTQVPGTQPWDRYYNGQGDHMYVRADLYSPAFCDWGYYAGEGNSGYIYTDQAPGSLPVYAFTKGSNSDRQAC